MLHHIGEPHLTHLALRLLVIQAQLKHFNLLPQIRQTSKDVIHGLMEVSLHIKPNPNQRPVLHGYYEKVWEFVENNYSEKIITPPTSKLASSLRGCLQNGPCNKCNPSYTCEHSANSRDKDDAVVSSIGICIAPLSDLFRYAHDLTIKLYHQYANLVSDSELIFMTSHLTQRNPELDVALAAGTSEGLQKSHTRRVKLSLFVPGFDINDYFSSLYAIFHECFVHGLCGITLKSDTAHLSDVFHEGWIDWVGLELLKRELKQLPRQNHNIVSKRSNEFFSFARKLSDRRSDYLSPNPCSEAEIYATGRIAARTLRALFQKIFDWDLADELFFNFSLLLNVSDFNDESRALLVANINSKLNDPDTGDSYYPSDLDPNVISAIHQFNTSPKTTSAAKTLANAISLM